MNTSNPVVGVIGLGIIGSIWAQHYHAANLLVGTWNRTLKSDAFLPFETPLALARKSTVIHIVIADPPAVHEILQQIRSALDSSKIIIQSSTIDPQSSNEFKALVTATGAQYLEAPFTGSKPAALNKQTIFYLGADSALIAKVSPILRTLSPTQIHIGTNAQACVLKLAMNLNIAAQMQALCEALTLARTAGISDDTFFSALKNNVSHSGLTTLKEPKLRAGDFSPQFSIKHLLKDMRLAAKTTGTTSLPLLNTTIQSLTTATASGLAESDISSLLKLLSQK